MRVPEVTMASLTMAPAKGKPQPMSPDNVTAMCASGKLSPALQTKYCSQK
jgi:hypothetical protein